MIDYATEYAIAVTSGKKECACKAEIQACARHLSDLKREDLEWRPDIAEKHIKFAELLKVYDKNDKKYKPLKLRGFQKFILCSLYGWYKDGIRRFSEGYVQLARKNGKSFLQAFNCLDFSSLSAIKDGQIYTTGTNYSNAAIVWQEIKKMIEADKNLSKYYVIRDYNDSRSSIKNKKNGSIIKAMSGDTDKDGFLPYLASVDEYHLHQTDEMYNVLLDGQSGLNNSLTIAITTAGKDLNSPCYKQYKYCKQVLAGTIEADNLFVFICEVDLPDSHKDEKEYNDALWNPNNWAMANPLLLYEEDGLHVTKDPNRWRDFSDIANKAKIEEGSVLNNFIIKKLDVWSTVGSEAFVNLDDWSSCGTEEKDITGKYCYIGLDLSSKNDLSSFSAVFPAQEGFNLPYLYSHSFLPKNTLESHIMRDKVPYDKFVKNGYLSLTDCDGQNGYILDYKFIARYIKEFIKNNQLKVKMIGYDSHQIGGIMADLDEIDAEKVEILQNPKSLNEATRHFQGTVRGRRLNYDRKNELLSWSIVNAIAVLNSKQELLIDKQNQRKRIDPIDAVLDGYKCMILSENDNTLDKEEQIDQWLSLMQEL